MSPFDYSLDFATINFREHPELYRVGRGEQGVLLVEPYKSELLPHWRFRTPELARASAQHIHDQFLAYKAAHDFVGMDMARKFLQMGFTRARRYANHHSGRNHVEDGDRWVVTPMQRDPDPESPAGGVSSTARDLAQWVRLQLGQGSFEGRQLIPTAALDPMHRPQSFSSVPQDLARQRTGFYCLGLNVSYTDFGAVQWSHSGAFALGAGTAFYLLPGSGFGVLG
jgi:CubicO group peptidase (beta-lactamase class C family)